MFNFGPKVQLGFLSTIATQLLASKVIQPLKKIKLNYNLNPIVNPSCNSNFFGPWLNNFQLQMLFGDGQKLKT
jgi:hypothetical protein